MTQDDTYRLRSDGLTPSQCMSGVASDSFSNDISRDPTLYVSMILTPSGSLSTRAAIGMFNSVLILLHKIREDKSG